MCLAAAAAFASCGDDEPVLTLVFDAVPTGTTALKVTLHAVGATFAGPDAGNAEVGVSYVGGSVVIAIDARFAAARANKIRLPLIAAENLTLEGLAEAIGSVPTKTAGTSTPVVAHQSAIMTFDFDDGSTDALAPADGRDGGDVAVDAGADMVSTDTAADMAATDTAADMAATDTAADMAATDTAADIAPPPDVSPDAPLPTSCTLGGQYNASTTMGGTGPAVARSAGGLFGLAWRGPGGDILYNAVSVTGTLQINADRSVAAASTPMLSAPRIARLGSEFVIAYGRRDASGGQAALVRVAPTTGLPVGTTVAGFSMSGATAAPEIGGLAVTGDEQRVAVINRPPNLGAQAPATVDVFGATLTFMAGRSPTQLMATRTTGIGWASDRFLAGAVTDMTNSGGMLLELREADLVGTVNYPFTDTNALPLVGSGTATIDIAAAGDLVAVAWLDMRSGVRQVWITTVSIITKTVLNAAQASTGSVSKHHPRVVFDGRAFALAWVEGSGTPDSQVKLARFDLNLTPAAATPMNVGLVGAVGLGDIDVAVAEPNAYGVAGAGSGGIQRLFYVTCSN